MLVRHKERATARDMGCDCDQGLYTVIILGESVGSGHRRVIVVIFMVKNI